MKILLLSLLLLMPVVAHADGIPGRGGRCQDEVCFEQQREIWRGAVAKADGHLAVRVEKMLTGWARRGFPDDDFIEKKYAKMHAQYIAELHKCGYIWLYEVQGHSKEVMEIRLANMVEVSEEAIFHGIIGAWLYKANQ
jgi:hypothetical protein